MSTFKFSSTLFVASQHSGCPKPVEVENKREEFDKNHDYPTCYIPPSVISCQVYIDPLFAAPERHLYL